MIRDGAKVAYIGYPTDGLEVGDEGKVFNAGNTGSHVQWATGARHGETDLVPNEDLVVTSAARPVMADSLETDLLGINVRGAYDRGGATRLLNAMNAEGHLASFSAYAEEAISLVAGRIRQDPSFREVLAALDPDEGEELVDIATSALLRDAFTEVD